MSLYKAPRGVLKSLESIRSSFFRGGNYGDNKISWVAWNRVLAAKQYGGLGVSSYFALNRALLLKWAWRFFSQDGSLWYRIIKVLYGQSIDSHTTKWSSTWCSILRELDVLKEMGFDFRSHCKIRLGNGLCTKFWTDVWVGDLPLYAKFPRLFALELSKYIFVAAKLSGSLDGSFRRAVRGGRESEQLEDLTAIIGQVSLSSSRDTSIFYLSVDGEFKVKDVRNSIDAIILPTHPEATRWVKFIPIKVNIFLWRARLDCLPTRCNLARRGIHMDSLLCSSCDGYEEDGRHVFFGCSFTKLILCRICNWWDLNSQPWSSFQDWLIWFDSVRLPSLVKSFLEATFAVAWWAIWRFRNRSIFDDSPPKRVEVFDDIVYHSFTWCSSRSNRRFSWVGWLKNPHLLSM